MRTAIIIKNQKDINKAESQLKQQIELEGMQLPVLLTMLHGEYSLHPAERRDFLQSIGYVIVKMA